MSKKYYRIILYALYSAAIVYAVVFAWTQYNKDKNDLSKYAPTFYDDIIINQNTSFSATPSNPNPYEIAFIKIKSIGFYSDSDYVYLKFSLGGTLPESGDDLPTYYDDKITSAVFNMSLDENYFDFLGNKNPPGAESTLRIDVYGNRPAQAQDNKIIVEGELLKGGPGFDYFVVRYPYRDVLFNQIHDYIVFTASSEITSEKYPEGASIYYFENSTLAATKSNNREVKLDLTLKDLRY